MRNDIKDDLKKLQEITFEAYKASGTLMAMLSSGSTDLNGVAEILERMAAQYERGVVALRNICEKYLSGNKSVGTKPAPLHLDLSGRPELHEGVRADNVETFIETRRREGRK